MSNKLSLQEGPLAEMKWILGGDQEPAGLEEKAPQAILPRPATGLVLQLELMDLGRLYQHRKGGRGQRVNSWSRADDDRRQLCDFLDMSRPLWSMGRWRWLLLPLLPQTWIWDWWVRRALWWKKSAANVKREDGAWLEPNAQTRGDEIKMEMICRGENCALPKEGRDWTRKRVQWAKSNSDPVAHAS